MCALVTELELLPCLERQRPFAEPSVSGVLADLQLRLAADAVVVAVEAMWGGSGRLQRTRKLR
jgi:hypothetical protein